MVSILLSLLTGLALLYFGAEGLVKGSSSFALRLGVSPLMIGLTIVAYGTSMPELVVSSKAALDGYGGIAIGNIVGSNIFNIAVTLGLSALIRPLRVNLQVIRLDMPVMIIASLLLLAFFQDITLTRAEGLLLTLGIVIYTVGMIYIARKEPEKKTTEEPQASIPGKHRNIAFNFIFIAGGFALLVLGARFLVDGSVKLAELWGVSRAVIGLTIIAAGTSLPELATSVIAAIHNETDIAIGNVVGSNIFNILGILGVSTLLAPLNGIGISMFDIYVMIGTAVLLLPLMRTGFVLNRWEGGVLLCVYGGYLYYLWPK
jgi:cation:H+ antiporter